MMVKAWLLGVVAVLAIGVRGVAAVNAVHINWVPIHGFLMWASMGTLLPLGTILIRYSRSQSNPELRRLHIIVQCAGVGLAIAGVAVLLRAKGPEFRFVHQRLGLALWIIVMVMPFIGIMRPATGKPSRSSWFFVHWLSGTAALILGVTDCFLGIDLYQRRHNSTAVTALKIVFAVQVAVMSLIYFLQDKWSYILSRGAIDESQLPDKIGGDRSGDISLQSAPA